MLIEKVIERFNFEKVIKRFNFEKEIEPYLNSIYVNNIVC